MRHFNEQDHPEYMLFEQELEAGEVFVPDAAVARKFLITGRSAAIKPTFTIGLPINMKPGLEIELICKADVTVTEEIDLAFDEGFVLGPLIVTSPVTITTAGYASITIKYVPIDGDEVYLVDIETTYPI